MTTPNLPPLDPALAVDKAERSEADFPVHPSSCSDHGSRPASDAPAPPRETGCPVCNGWTFPDHVRADGTPVCGKHKDRAASPAQEAPSPHPVRPHTPGWGGDL